MTLTDWYRDHIANSGGWREAGYELYLGALRRCGDATLPTMNVYDRDWDVLVLLDACRADALRAETDWNVDTLWSVASSSPGWLDRTFSEAPAADVRNTAYVTANPFSSEYCDPDQFADLIEAWRTTRDDSTGTYPARDVTDHAIATARATDADRLIVHYMQPHFPSVPKPVGGALPAHDEWGEGWDDPVDRLRAGEASAEEVREAYRANLHYVLDEVDALCRNVDAETVAISADHGEAFGELGVYGHPDVAIPTLRRVPWVTCSATDQRTRTPNVDLDAARRGRVTASADVEQRLEDLGYA